MLTLCMLSGLHAELHGTSCKFHVYVPAQCSLSLTYWGNCCILASMLFLVAQQAAKADHFCGMNMQWCRLFFLGMSQL